MSTTGGLSRRRVGGGDQASETSPTTTSAGPSSDLKKSTNGSTGNNNASTSNNTQSSPNLNNRSSHKVGYDPRDMDDQDEERFNPKLTLMEEVLLMGLKDKQGYLSFWNDNISYTLRGAIIIELALRNRIGMVKDPNRRRFPLPDRYIEVIDERLTGEVLLDEALKMMKVSERMSVGTWIDLMSGETWNVMKIGYQLKQVRERLAKGLVDKGVLRTEKRNFLLFDMATHPVSDPTFKDDVLRRTSALLSARTAAVPTSEFYSETVRYRTIRAVCMVCAAFAANVLENALVHLGYDARESAFAKCDELMAEFSQWPFGKPPTAQTAAGLGQGSGGHDAQERSNLAEISRLARAEAAEGSELQLEIVAAVLQVYSRMDSLL